jgi:hypothetical protein
LGYYTDVFDSCASRSNTIDLAFPEIRDEDFGYSMFLYSIDIFFTIDIILNSITAFENSLEEIVDDRFALIFNY